MRNKELLFIFCDGSSRGNPGPAAIGITAQTHEGEEIFSIAEKIGIATNNIAEWKALQRGMEEAIARDELKVKFKLDSELVVKQMKGEYKVKNSGLLTIKQSCEKLKTRFDFFEIIYIPREQNSRADALANIAQDTKL
ncbi:ribonuclease HI family protein [Leptospira ognonensis]|uniref:Ribonuclease HI family protein n=1 Tax=Leptospira ognonensis TaxID=2484945 RepID=A0A4R9K240_9LEPT|nr:ribonuclease HI family protein [Leptospira ognonensis]TGL60053.1 ribonuclease HI family protein [Leptospira ognonensis]